MSGEQPLGRSEEFQAQAMEIGDTPGGAGGEATPERAEEVHPLSPASQGWGATANSPPGSRSKWKLRPRDPAKQAKQEAAQGRALRSTLCFGGKDNDFSARLDAEGWASLPDARPHSLTRAPPPPFPALTLHP